MKNKQHHKKQLDYFEKEFSDTSDYTLAPWQKSYVEKIKKDLLDKNYKQKTLLDIATGSGYIARELAKYGVKVIACDMSPSSISNLNAFKKKYKINNLKAFVCMAESIPLKNKSVDYIVANAILEHIPEEKKTITEWKRLLKPKGKVFITVPIKLKHIWPFLWPINMYYDTRLGHLRRYDADDLKNKFRLKVKKVYYTGHIVKVIGALFSLIFNIHLFDNFLEQYDKKSENKRYGANNISVLLQK